MLTTEQILTAIKKACDQAEVTAIPIDVDLKELGYDSMDMFNIFLEIEALTGRSIPDEDIERLQSVQAIQDYFNNYKR